MIDSGGQCAHISFEDAPGYGLTLFYVGGAARRAGVLPGPRRRIYHFAVCKMKKLCRILHSLSSRSVTKTNNFHLIVGEHLNTLKMISLFQVYRCTAANAIVVYASVTIMFIIIFEKCWYLSNDISGGFGDTVTYWRASIIKTRN